jgi:hypothetical protein
MNEILTPEDHIERQIVATTNTIAVAYRAFGETNTTYEEHHVRSRLLEPTESVPVNHQVDINLTVPVELTSSGEVVPKGDRKLTFTVLGEDRERGSGPADHDGKHSMQLWFGIDETLETPVLAKSTMAYNLHRPKWVNSILALDGAYAGLAEIQNDDPSFFLDIAANLEQSRSMSIRRLGAITTLLALDYGQSSLKQHGRLDMDTFMNFMEDSGFTRDEVLKAHASRNLETFIYSSIGKLVESETEPRTFFTKASCTYFKDGTRMDSTLYETDYTGWSPIDPDMHAVFSQVLDPETEEIGVKARAFDGKLSISSYPDMLEIISAEDPQSLGRILRHMRRGSEAYINTAASLFRDRATKEAS